MTPHEFITKWRASALKERSASQEHFIDLCRLLGEPTPAEADPSGETYCFERGARKDTGGDGWADVWKRHHFAWEPGFPIWLWYFCPFDQSSSLDCRGFLERHQATEGDTQWVNYKRSPFSSRSTDF